MNDSHANNTGYRFLLVTLPHQPTGRNLFHSGKRDICKEEHNCIIEDKELY